MSAPDRMWVKGDTAVEWLGACDRDGFDPRVAGMIDVLPYSQAREHAEELVEHLIWIRYQIDNHGASAVGPMLARTTELLSKLDQ